MKTKPSADPQSEASAPPPVPVLPDNAAPLPEGRLDEATEQTVFYEQAEGGQVHLFSACAVFIRTVPAAS